MTTLNRVDFVWDGRILAAGPAQGDLCSWDNPVNALNALGSQDHPPDPDEVDTGCFGSFRNRLRTQSAEICVVSVDTMFAPVAEYCVIRTRIKNIGTMGDLVMQILYQHRDTHTAQLVYAEKLTYQQVFYLAANRGRVLNTPFANRLTTDADRSDRNWATPEMSPFSVRFFIAKRSHDLANTLQPAGRVPKRFGTNVNVVTNSVESQSLFNRPLLRNDQTSVRYHSISLDRISWEDIYEYETGSPPNVIAPDAAHSVAWQKLILNRIGCFAGPISDAPDDDLTKAITRYRHMRALQQADDVNASLRQENLANPAFTVLADANNFSNAQQTVMLFIDSNRFYAADAEFAENGAGHKKFDLDTAWLSNPWLPIKVVVKVKNKGGAETYIPEAATGAKVQFSWSDKEPDLSNLPGDSAAQGRWIDEVISDAVTAHNAKQHYQAGDFQSKTKAFIQEISSHKHIRSRFKSNARDMVGGLIEEGQDAKNSRIIFRRLSRGQMGVEFSDNDVKQENDAHYSVGDDGSGNSPGWVTVDCLSAREARQLRGVAPVYLRPSTLAGEHYQIAAKLAIAKHIAPMNTFQGEEESRIKKHTATLQSWRRVRLAAKIHWPTANSEWTGDLPQNCFAQVKREFEHAFVSIQDESCQDLTFPLPRRPRQLFQLGTMFRNKYNEVFCPTGDASAAVPVDRVVPGDFPVPAFLLALPSRDDLVTALNTIQLDVSGRGDDYRALLDLHEFGQARIEVQNRAFFYSARDLTDLANKLNNTYGPIFHAALSPARVSPGTIQRTIGILPDVHGKFWIEDAFEYYKGKTPGQSDYPGITYNLQADLYGRIKKALTREIFTKTGTSEDAMAKYKEFTQRIEPHIRQYLKESSLLCHGLVLIHHRGVPSIVIHQDGGENITWDWPGFSIGCPKGCVWISQTTPMRFYAVVCHEMGHTIFMKHWINGDGPVGDDHDIADKNCIMSYPLLQLPLATALQQQAQRTFEERSSRGTYGEIQRAIKNDCHDFIVGEPENYVLPKYFTPHFCGKCNLKLRGWKIDALSQLGVDAAQPQDDGVPPLPPPS